MKTSKFGRLVSVVVIGTCLIKAVLYGGSKPPATTNTPPDSAGCDAPTKAAPLVLTASRPRLALSAPPPQTENEPSAIPHSSFNIQHSWTARGAYCDWTRVDFPDGFGFDGDGPLAGCVFMTFDLLFWEISILWGFWTTASTPGEQAAYSRCGPARFRE